MASIVSDRQDDRRCLQEAERYCRQLALRHYENFTVASRLIPRYLRQHFFNIYAFCRFADDLADELSDPQESLQRLQDWHRQLLDCYRGQAQHPVFVALRGTIGQFDLPCEPFEALLRAFARDQRQNRYESFEELLDYCRDSANPVGQLVLYLVDSYTSENARLSNRICTGLQLANFCQDVARDYDRGRIYLPQETCRDFGYTEQMFERRVTNEALRGVLALQVERARQHLLEGHALVSRIPGKLGMQIDLYVQGGLAILRAIERIDYDVWACRPTLRAHQKLWLLGRAWCRAQLGRLP